MEKDQMRVNDMNAFTKSKDMYRVNSIWVNANADQIKINADQCGTIAEWMQQIIGVSKIYLNEVPTYFAWWRY